MTSKEAFFDDSMEYLARHQVRDLFAKMSQELYCARPRDSLSFMVDFLEQYQEERKADPSRSPMDLVPASLAGQRRIILVVGRDVEQCAAYAKQLCRKYARHTYVDLQAQGASLQIEERLPRLQEAMATDIDIGKGDGRHAATIVVTGAIGSIQDALKFEEIICEPWEVHVVDNLDAAMSDSLAAVVEYYSALEKILIVKYKSESVE